MNRVLFSAKTDEWATPKHAYEVLDREFHFDFDPCPINGEQDARSTLFCEWRGRRCFINPPYSDTRKFLERWHEPALAVYLIPARVDTRWFHDLVLPFACEIRFIRGRLKFGDAINTAPFPSMVVIYEHPPLPGQVRIPLVRSMTLKPRADLMQPVCNGVEPPRF